MSHSVGGGDMGVSAGFPVFFSELGSGLHLHLAHTGHWQGVTGGPPGGLGASPRDVIMLLMFNFWKFGS